MIADLAVHDRRGQLAVLVDVKTSLGTDSAWAAQTRRNLVAGGIELPPYYYLLVVPDRFYLWTKHAAEGDAAPDYVADAEEALSPYFQGSEISPETIGPDTFELLVGFWLNALAVSESVATDPKYAWLRDSGLFDILRTGRVLWQSPV